MAGTRAKLFSNCLGYGGRGTTPWASEYGGASSKASWTATREWGDLGGASQSVHAPECKVRKCTISVIGVTVPNVSHVCFAPDDNVEPGGNSGSVFSEGHCPCTCSEGKRRAWHHIMSEAGLRHEWPTMGLFTWWGNLGLLPLPELWTGGPLVGRLGGWSLREWVRRACLWPQSNLHRFPVEALFRLHAYRTLVCMREAWCSLVWGGCVAFGGCGAWLLRATCRGFIGCWGCSKCGLIWG